MGILRLLFAACVVLWHCPTGIVERFIHPALAVQCFYAISGFLIQMVIRAKYQGAPHWRRRFWASRFLRIYPLYIFFLMLTLAFPDEAVAVLSAGLHQPAVHGSGEARVVDAD